MRTAPDASSRWQASFADRRDRILASDRWRSPRVFDARGPEGDLDGAGRRVVSFASNDYLGLGAHPAVVAAADAALDRWGAGLARRWLVTGTRPVHRDLEEAMAAHTRCEAAVCLPTGFAANLGALSVLGTPGTRIISDELNHASIIDGCRMAKAEVAVYRHGDADHAEALLGASVAPAVVVTDTVFSMDGDVAPLVDLAAACRRHDALLMLDEAHAVLGPTPGPEVTDDLTVVRVGTLSKTLGSLGGVVSGPCSLIDLVVNEARPYVFTTAPAPAAAAAALAALGVLRSSEGEALVRRLATHVGRVAPEHPSPIVPVIMGAEDRALAASAALLELGLWVPAIRPPTVPSGTSRLRITLSAAHTDEQVGELVDAIVHLSAHELAG